MINVKSSVEMPNNVIAASDIQGKIQLLKISYERRTAVYVQNLWNEMTFTDKLQ